MIMQAMSWRETQRSGKAEREANSTGEYIKSSKSTGKYFNVLPLH